MGLFWWGCPTVMRPVRLLSGVEVGHFGGGGTVSSLHLLQQFVASVALVRG